MDFVSTIQTWTMNLDLIFQLKSDLIINYFEIFLTLPKIVSQKCDPSTCIAPFMNALKCWYCYIQSDNGSIPNSRTKC